MDRVRYLRLTVAAAVAVALAAAVGMSLVRSSGEKAGVRSGTGSSPRAIPVAEPATIMWRPCICGVQTVDAVDSALPRSGAPHNPCLAASNRPGVAGAWIAGDRYGDAEPQGDRGADGLPSGPAIR